MSTQRPTFAGLQFVGVHGQAHTAASLSPFETGFGKYSVQTFLLGLLLDDPAAGDNHGADAIVNFFAAYDFGGSTQILDPRIGT